MKKYFTPQSILIVIGALVILGGTYFYLTTYTNVGRKEVASYRACGCGTCPSTTLEGKEKDTYIYYSKSRGEEAAYHQAVANDKAMKNNDVCATVGCRPFCDTLILLS